MGCWCISFVFPFPPLHQVSKAPAHHNPIPPKYQLISTLGLGADPRVEARVSPHQNLNNVQRPRLRDLISSPIPCLHSITPSPTPTLYLYLRGNKEKQIMRKKSINIYLLVGSRGSVAECMCGKFSNDFPNDPSFGERRYTSVSLAELLW